MDEQRIKSVVSEKGPIRLSKLLACASPGERALVELRVLHMVKKGILRAERAEKDILLTVGPSGEEKAEASPFVNTEVAIVATLPMGVQHKHAELRRCIGMLAAFNMLIAGAKWELRISSPFADPETIALLRPSFRKAAGGGVMIKFLTRSARDRQLLAALRSISDVYAKLGIPDKFSVKCYEVSVAGMLVEAIHAKVVIADRRVAYVGSGELRRHSLTADVEIGVLLRGAAVEHLADLFDVVWEKAATLNFRPA
jgi:phosphatidylserine/phosphatidylglycerophosphate/cardiolipin synthase-like enzyme